MSKRKTPAPRAPRAKRTGKHIAIRMYNVGFGDCFLIRIPTGEGERRMLVDCGYHSQGKGDFSDKELVGQIKTDLNGESLHVVVATHRHQDHISGFGEPELWSDIGVEEVWLPFTANPAAGDSDPALRAWEGLMRRAGGVVDANGNLTAAARSSLGARSADDQAAAAFMLWNARENAPGIKNLLTGMRQSNGQPAKRRFLPGPADAFPSHFITSALPGVTVHVLGPSKDPKLRKSMKVPSTWGFGEAMPGAGAGDMSSPFSAEWRIPKERLPRPPFNESSLKQIRLFNDDLLLAAAGLDGFLNGESLVLVLQIGSARLLLPGDAEVGTWKGILENPDALALASSATFLKVGHHGSHNATPLIFVSEHLAKQTPAVISTQEGPGNFRNGIPLQDLLDRMTAHNMPFARSDKPPATTQGKFSPGPGGHWIDCSIPC
jgi:beta-lactamase superfamily II metal-dependent hydrolase